VPKKEMNKRRRESGMIFQYTDEGKQIKLNRKGIIRKHPNTVPLRYNLLLIGGPEQSSSPVAASK
jgi:hypothetical protein